MNRRILCEFDKEEGNQAFIILVSPVLIDSNLFKANKWDA